MIREWEPLVTSSVLFMPVFSGAHTGSAMGYKYLPAYNTGTSRWLIAGAGLLMMASAIATYTLGGLLLSDERPFLGGGQPG